MNNHIRTSEVEKIMELRAKLWEKVYCNNDCIKMFYNKLYNNFIPNTININDYNFELNIFEMTSLSRPFVHDEVNPRIKNAYIDFIQYVYSIGILSDEEYGICINNSNMFFFITFISNHNIKINL